LYAGTNGGEVNKHRFAFELFFFFFFFSQQKPLPQHLQLLLWDVEFGEENPKQKFLIERNAPIRAIYVHHGSLLAVSV
jgi:hypothetical protein